MNTLICDIRYACRTLTRQSTSTMIMVSILTIGMAGSVTILSVFYELNLKPLPVPDSKQLVILNESAPQMHMDQWGISPPDFHAWRAENQSFESMTFWHEVGRNLSFSDSVERVRALAVTRDFFRVMGICPILGRSFSPEEDQPNGPKVVLLSHNLWERLCGRDPNILGSTLRLDTVPHVIVGVMAPNWSFPQEADLWIPLAVGPNQRRGAYYLSGCGRLKQAVTLDQAQADLTHIHKGMADTRPANKLTTPRLTPIREYYLGKYRHISTMLLGVVGLMLLIVCSNASGMMLARGTSRMKEITIRSWLGATRGRIMQQILIESLVVSVLGGLLGILLGRLIIMLILTQWMNDIAPWMTFALSPGFFGLCVLTIMLTTVLCGAVPALHISKACCRADIVSGAGGQNNASSTPYRIMNTLMIGEVALTLILLIGTGLLLKAFKKVNMQDPGFRVQGILTYQISLPPTTYQDINRRQQFFEQHLARVRTLPGVNKASLISNAPLISNQGEAFIVEDGPQDPAKQNIPILTRSVLSDYFVTMGVPLSAGRVFNEHDYHPESEPAVIVNEAFAKHFWPGQNALGKRITKKGKTRWMRIIGVTRDVKHQGPDQSTVLGVYLPYPWDRRFDMHGVLHASGDPLTLTASIRDIVCSQDPDMTIHNVMTMSERIYAATRVRRAYTWSFSIIAGIATVMAVSGLYGVFTYSVSRRKREIGIRLALGAQTWDILSHVLRRGLILVGSGLAIGLVAACMLSRILSAYLFSVDPIDLRVYITTSIVLILVVLPACVIPAHNAANTDPIEVLRYE